ncbi:TlpA family protein disulfide reductase [Hymenobacter convexus]|uniref:TlpA family protein disulfide reductase n=1 Tax=Hymenobacter sp. CA1UV-4 TaxID=3063782 RepID=UPI002712D781|nr:TlpA disulfide reductase family protein [Hymenobacter sp. CA1UV-4]MDO7852311.1 TlpA disulfide reductase family protein [Hymenobacter sp. CA1UV-4]
MFLHLLISFCLYWGQFATPPREQAPAFRLQDVAGKAVALQDFRGKVVYLDFWFSGCGPCLAQAPAAQRLNQRFKGKDVVFLYISTDAVVETWRASIVSHKLDGPNTVHLLDPEGRAFRAYRAQGYPTYFLIGRNGELLQRAAPRPSAGRTIIRAIEQALEEKTAPNLK